jgi:DNA-binding transcriptional LysR family regulator
MPYFLSDFMKKHEMVDVTMDVTNKMSVIRTLENNECDFAMVSTIPNKLNIARIELMKNKLYFVAGKDLYKTTSLKTLNNASFIFREQGSATRLEMERFLVKHKITINKKMELTSNEAVKQAVIAGLGISIMPIIGIKNELEKGELQILEIKNLPIETNWNLIWLKSKNLSLVAKAFKDHIETHKEEIIKKHFAWFSNQ